jgi:hypothetical protein
MTEGRGQKAEDRRQMADNRNWEYSFIGMTGFLNFRHF